MNVLIVDDDISTVNVIKNNIDWEGFYYIEKVYSAYNIETAKKSILKHDISIIITDIEMPMGSGISLLKWFRDKNLEGEFMFLTCHERFDYATEAIKLDAFEYLLKPFKVDVMEEVLKKIIQTIINKNQLQKNSKYISWLNQNQDLLRSNFFYKLLQGQIESEPKDIKSALEDYQLPISINAKYFIVVSRVTNTEIDRLNIQPNSICSMMGNIHSEIFNYYEHKSIILYYDYNEYYVLISIIPEEQKNKLGSKCTKLINRFNKVFSSTITVCISKSCSMTEFYTVYHRILGLIKFNVGYYGEWFYETQICNVKKNDNDFINSNELTEFLLNKNKIGFLDYLKTHLNKKLNNKTLDYTALEIIKSKILESTYIYFINQHISPPKLFTDDIGNKLNSNASRSVIDMIKWVNFVIDGMFKYESDIFREQSLIEKINKYVELHYNENIGRKEIAENFCVTPDYLSKIYKRKTGKNLGDFINEVKVNQSKYLLSNNNMMIIDVAISVGFWNSSYYSTVFKKYTGMTPNQYRDSLK